MNDHLQFVAGAIARNFGPRPRMSVSEWCEANLIFDEAGNRGPFSLAGREFMREIVDAWGDPMLTDQVPVCGSQAGKTAGIMAGAAWRIVHDPARVFWVFPTRDTSQGFSRTRWQPMLRRSAPTAPLVPTGSRRHDFATFRQMLGGSVVDMVWSNSPAALASVPANVCILDEVDKFDQGGRKEADAVDLAEQRTKSFANPKRIKTSTPTLDTGLIWQELLKTDFRRWFVPCPHCGKDIILAWSETATVLPRCGMEAWAVWDRQSKRADGSWDLDRVAASARYECPHCAGHIIDAHKTRMNRAGHWEPTQAGTPGWRGWHLPSLYAPSVQANIGTLAVKWLTAARSYQGLQGFLNGNLAEPYMAQEKRGTRREMVVERMEVESANAERLLLTVDVQARAPYFWFVVRRWVDGNSEAIDAGPLNSWEEVAEKQAQHGIPPQGVAVDSGFGTRDEVGVYRECWLHGQTLGDGFRLCWMPTKGIGGRKLWKDRKSGLYVPYMTTEQDPWRGTSRAGEAQIDLWMFSSDIYKDILADLRDGNHPWQWTVNKAVATDTYWQHLDAEHKVEHVRPTGPVYTWEKRAQRWPNHLFDCEVLQVFLASFLQLFPIEFDVGGPRK